jgi:hypothetical protein
VRHHAVAPHDRGGEEEGEAEGTRRAHTPDDIATRPSADVVYDRSP